MSFPTFSCWFSHSNYLHMQVLGMVTDLTGEYILQFNEKGGFRAHTANCELTSYGQKKSKNEGLLLVD
jgi:hypothetical protein